MHKPNKWIVVPLTCLLLFTGAAVWWLIAAPSSRDERAELDFAALASEQQAIVQNAKESLAAGNYDDALRICEAGLTKDPTLSSLLIIAGEAATKLGDFQNAIAYYSAVQEADTRSAALAKWAAGEIYFHLGQPSECVDSLRNSLRLEPRRVEAHERLLSILCDTGQRAEILPHAIVLLKSDLTTIPLLVELGNLWTEHQNWQEIERFRKSSPNDPLLALVDANRLLANGQLEEAESKTQQVLIQQPDLVAAHILLGKIWLLSDSGKWDSWNQALPQSAEQSPDVWHVRGSWQEILGEPRAATRCYAESVKRSPNHLAAHLDLARLLSGYGEEFSSVANALADRATALQVLQQTIDRIRIHDRYEETIRIAAEKCVELSRAWEAIGWCGYGMQLSPKAAWPRELIEKTRAIAGVNATMDHTLSQGRLLDGANWLTEFELPGFNSRKSLEPSLSQALPESSIGETPQDKENSKIRFDEIAAASGIEFSYHRSGQDRSTGRRMFEFTGGGVGVIDFDADGYEDIFLSQATDWPRGSVGTVSDKLYRSVGLGASRQVRFEDCSRPAKIIENEYGQGVTIADVNADGFDDVYVGNYGPNQLWINQGDGTFESGRDYVDANVPSYWTASTLCIDLNQDAIPDLIDINYVVGEKLEEMRCDVDGQPRVCPPLVFQPAPLEIHLSQSEGTFQRLEWQGNQLAFNGLGGIAFRDVASGEPRIFVASDQKANGLLAITANVDAGSDRPSLQIRDSAILSGIAYDRNGLAQACMGIAAGDLTGNGEVDLIVTNFFGETNTVYIQEDRSFSDQTLRWGLATASRPMLGFGAQLFDATLDGRLDLAVLNGHIDDFTHIGIPEKMTPQVFTSTGENSFAEVAGEKLGPFFKTPALGRAMAIADINQDGLVDLLCTDLEAPFALLENRSDVEGDYVVIELVGTESDRNGFLSIVEIKSGDYQASAQLIAGSGYMASNSHFMHFALPKRIEEGGRSEDLRARESLGDSTAVQVTVKWPSGREEQFQSLPRNSRSRLVEGRGLEVNKNR